MPQMPQDCGSRSASDLKNRAFLVYEVVSFTVIFVQTILMQGVIYYFDEFTVPMSFAYASLGVGAMCGISLEESMERSELPDVSQ